VSKLSDLNTSDQETGSHNADKHQAYGYMHVTSTIMCPIIPIQRVPHNANGSQLLATTHHRKEEVLKAYSTQN
jgi:hypothetical protein